MIFIYLVVCAVPNILQFLMILSTETVRLEQVVQLAVVAAVKSHGYPGTQNRFAAGTSTQFRRRKRPQKSRQTLHTYNFFTIKNPIFNFIFIENNWLDSTHLHVAGLLESFANASNLFGTKGHGHWRSRRWFVVIVAVAAVVIVVISQWRWRWCWRWSVMM